MGQWAGTRVFRVAVLALAPLLLLVIAVVLFGGGGSPSKPPPVKNTLPTVSASPIASPVVVTGTSTKVQVTGSTPGIAPGRSLNFVSQVYSLGPSGPLASPAKVTIQLDNALPASTPVVVATREAPTGSWSYLPATLTSDGQHAQFTTTHLSEFGVMSIDLAQVVSDFKAAVAPALVSTVDIAAGRPTCSGTTQALADGYSVGSADTPADAATALQATQAAAAAASSASGPAQAARPTIPAAQKRKTLFFCLGLSGTKRVVTVVNRRPFPVQVDHGTSTTLAVDSRVAGLWASWYGVLAPGSTTTFLAPGGSASYAADLQPKTMMQLTAGNDAVAQSLRVLYAAVSAIDAQVQRFGVADPQPLDTFNTLLARRPCARSLGNGSAAILAGCFAPRAVLSTFGTNGQLLLPLVAAPGMKSFFANQFSFLADQDVSVDTQTVYVGRAAPDFGALVGVWTGHTRSLRITADGLVVEKIASGCCKRVIDLTYQLSEPRAAHGTTTAKAVLTGVTVYDRKTLGGKAPQVGATGTISLTKGVITPPFIATNFCGPLAAKNGACGA